MYQFYAPDVFKSIGSHSVSIFKFQAFIYIDMVSYSLWPSGEEGADSFYFLIFDLQQNPNVYTLYALLLKFKLVHLSCKQKTSSIKHVLCFMVFSLKRQFLQNWKQIA